MMNSFQYQSGPDSTHRHSMVEAHQYDDGGSLLVARHGDSICRVLETCYPGIRFNRVQIHFLSSSALRDNPDGDDMDASFGLSGTAVDLLRHGFAHANWWPMIDASRTSRGCDTPGFGRIWLATRTRTGYRLEGARYSDSMTKLALASLPDSWQSRFGVPGQRKDANRRSN